MSPAARVALALFAGVAVLGGLVWLGRAAREDLDRRGHYTLVVDQLDMPAPPGMTRLDFLAEVVREGKLEPKLDRSDAATAGRLKAAFAAHPWVESVEVGDLSQPQPVTLTLRTPALAVNGRVLDRLGVLLPLRTSAVDLPEYRGAVPVHFGASGQPISDPISLVARIVSWLRVHLSELKWQAVELTNDGLVLISNGRKAIWGHGTADEPPAEEKLGRLKTWKSEFIDLRSK